MTTSRPGRGEAFVWIWLPGATDPVVAGKLTVEGEDLVFNYGQSYLGRDDAISIHEAELPLRPGALPLVAGLHVPNCIRDAAPDAWGRRVIMNKVLGTSRPDVDTAELDELTYLLESGSDRIGALDFQRSPTEYEPRMKESSTLEELQRAAEKVEKGIPLSPELDQALIHGSSIGGARPKALIEEASRKCIAKFSSSSDLYSVVKAEFVAMRLAKIVGLDVASVSLTRSWDKDVLLIERFDRIPAGDQWLRKHMISALTLFELDDMTARYASYEKLAEIIRHRFKDPTATLRELFSRLVFNVLCGNTDDHARNHTAFWDGQWLALTPAYDICPQPRSGNEASQAMLIAGGNRMSQVASCLEAAPAFHLTRGAALEIALNQKATIRDSWEAVCDEARLTGIDRALLWGRQFLNPYSMVGIV
ncbi:type II toxin-antitoxin system HipA family toxin [bacterium]|nr:type II toxin-antitoxin system HipA family toxin [bacterium]